MPPQQSGGKTETVKGHMISARLLTIKTHTDVPLKTVACTALVAAFLARRP